MDLSNIPTHQLVAWVAFGLSIAAPLLVASYLDKKRKRNNLQPLLGVVAPKKKGKK